MIEVPFTGSLDATRRIKTVHAINLTENGADPGAAARVQLKDADANGQLHADIRLIAAEFKNLSFDPPLRFPHGVFIQVSSGTVRGEVIGT